MNFNKIAFATSLAVSGSVVSSIFTSVNAATLELDFRGDTSTATSIHLVIEYTPPGNNVTSVTGNVTVGGTSFSITELQNSEIVQVSPPFLPFSFDILTNNDVTNIEKAFSILVTSNGEYRLKDTSGVINISLVPEPLNILGTTAAFALLGATAAFKKRRKISK